MPDLPLAEVGEILQLLQRIEGCDGELKRGGFTSQVRRRDSPERLADLNAAKYPALATAPAYVNQVDAPAQSTSESMAAQRALPTPTTDPACDDVPDHWVAVGAPVVGAFYRASKPEESPFVEIGDTVASGRIVLGIEQS